MKNNNEPLVSVIIHSFDRFQYLLNAIRSIENQTYKNYELILINDDSNEKEASAKKSTSDKDKAKPKTSKLKETKAKKVSKK